jgi:hypothetical protein
VLCKLLSIELCFFFASKIFIGSVIIVVVLSRELDCLESCKSLLLVRLKVDHCDSAQTVNPFREQTHAELKPFKSILNLVELPVAVCQFINQT